MLKLPCGFCASFSAPCTINCMRKEMESEKDLSRGCCNSGYNRQWDILDVRHGSVPLGA